MREPLKKVSLHGLAIYIVLIAIFTFFSIFAGGFFSTMNIINVLRQVSIIGICAVGMACVIITGGIDLSVGAVIGIASVLTAKLMVSGVHPVAACIVMLCVGILVGVVNTIFVYEIGLPPLIATLGTMTILRGVAYLITGGMPVYGFDRSFTVLGQGYVFNTIPIPVIIMVFTFILGYILLNKMKVGRYIYGVGSNEEAARLSGVSVRKTKYLTYCVCGFLSALAGIVLLSRVNSGQPIAGTSYEMDIITACVLGGISITGGEGKITGVVVGVLIMGVLANGMIMMDIPEYYQWVVKGSVLLCAVSYDKLSLKKLNQV